MNFEIACSPARGLSSPMKDKLTTPSLRDKSSPSSIRTLLMIHTYTE
ncbi:unnamed protein product [Larinioides sclopetarius]|uniref:Uncharacterized protein n=1 Tax=Larinioides sclopetarius TaxID=280406 RepID=A0AAV1ZES3_9ARAC